MKNRSKIAATLCAAAVICGCAHNQTSPKSGIAAGLDRQGLVAYWDFAGAAPLVSKASDREYKLEPAGSVAFDSGAAGEGKSLYLDGKSYLTIPYAQTGALNVKSGSVSVLAWVKKQSGSKIGFVAGMWNEYENGGKRQYGLFVSLPAYNGADQVCGHISKNGGPTPPFRYSIDYSASAQKVPFDEWTFVAFTYDGKYIRSYVNGEFGARQPELIDHTKGFKGYPDGLVQCKNPYYYPDGIGDNGSDFTVGAVCLKKGMGNFFMGNIRCIAVYNRALSDAEISAIYKKTR